MRVRMRPDIPSDSTLPVPSNVLNADGIKNSFLHEIEKFTPGGVIEEKRQMRKSRIRIFPIRSRLSGQFRRRFSKAVGLLSQSDLEITAPGRCAETDQSMIFAGES